MNRFAIPLCFAAVLAVSAARASDAVQISFDGACNTLSLSTFRTAEDAVLGGKKCPQGLATGFLGTFKSGNAIGLGTRFDSDPAGYYLVLSKPIATGGAWTLYKSADGKASTSTSGTYSVVGDPTARPQSGLSITRMIPAASKPKARTVVVSFDGFCNVETITLSSKGSSMLETGDGCDENIGEGLASKIKHVGKTYGFGWTSNGARGAGNDLVFTEPFKTGGTVTIYYTTNGITQNVTGPITYTVETGFVRPRIGLKPLGTLLH
ncbi:MAG TPA: hypothetical protein VGF97_18915 [Rhizomicrobium sp.]|jgi:hypothetical protein